MQATIVNPDTAIDRTIQAKVDGKRTGKTVAVK
jgi:hypothetical protein